MAVAKSSGYTEGSPFWPYNCYKNPSLELTILDANKTGNLTDNYILGEQLGLGQFGIIRKCVDRFSNEALACKSIAKDRLVTEEDVRSIKLEIEIMTKLSGHPNVVDLKAVYEEEGYVHLVMELCAGGELFHELEKHGRFSEIEARVFFRQLMEVVMYCHDKGVVHRDLKPENILLSKKAPSSPIKLADFGLATYINHGQSLHGRVGSPFYIAPEVLSGGYDESADVWSAGVILYILLSGVPPFWGKTKSRIFDSVRTVSLRFPSNPWDFISSTVKELIRGMLCREPSRRLTARQVLDHPWVRNNGAPNEQSQVSLSSFSSALISTSREISFGDEFRSTPIAQNSSFSSFLVGPPTTSVELGGGFFFQSSGGSGMLELSTSVIALPSFAFVGQSVVITEKGSSSLNPRADLPVAGEENRRAVEERKGKPSVRKLSRRNHTIGLGELEQIDLMVTESVIRWASCTHLSKATSFRSSLVC